MSISFQSVTSTSGEIQNSSGKSSSNYKKHVEEDNNNDTNQEPNRKKGPRDRSNSFMNSENFSTQVASSTTRSRYENEAKQTDKIASDPTISRSDSLTRSRSGSLSGLFCLFWFIHFIFD